MKKLFLLFLFTLVLTGCTNAGAADIEKASRLVIYSGRSEKLIAPIIEQFEQASGIQVDVRWGNTAQLATTLLEEGPNSPADLFFAQDPGGLGAVQDLLLPLPETIITRTLPGFSDPAGLWVGISGRVRTVVYNTNLITPEQLPTDIWGFVNPEWKGKIGWAPTNASFQTMVTAMRTQWGEEKTRQWLEGIMANAPIAYESNSAIVQAVGAGEVAVGFVNHYYLMRFITEQGESFPARNHFITEGPGNLVMVAGAGILKSGKNHAAAEKFIEFMLSPVAQQYFTSQTFEYPVVEGVALNPLLPNLATLPQHPVNVADLQDLQASINLLRSVGALP